MEPAQIFYTVKNRDGLPMQVRGNLMIYLKNMRRIKIRKAQPKS